MNETVERVRILKRLHDLGVYLIGVAPGADLGADLENREKIAREDLASQFPGDTNAAAAWGTKSGGLINVAINVTEGRRVAATRWRTLHEITVVLLFIDQEDEILAERYRLHERIESFRAAQEYQKHHDLLGFEAIGHRKLVAYERECERLSQLYGPRFMTQYGWADAAMKGRRPKGLVRFQDLEDAVEESKMRPFYRMASHAVHAGPKGANFAIGTRRSGPYQRSVSLACSS